MTGPHVPRELIAKSGRICFWPGGSLWVGRGAGRTTWHAHHAHQMAISLDGICRFRSSKEADWTEFEGAVVPSHCAHEFEFDGGIAHLFVEPETTQGRALSRQFDQLRALPEETCAQVSGVLRAAEAAGTQGEELIAAGRCALALLTGPLAPGKPVDARIAGAVVHIGKHVREALTLADVASAVCLSPGRFRHLFVEETGTPFRAYLLWMRLQTALDLAMTGESWTVAAHESGFADAAHLTRTFKRMFGINPSDLANLPKQAASGAAKPRMEPSYGAGF